MEVVWVDHYAVLGLSPGASATEIRKAWVLRANVFHPDRMQGMSDTTREWAEDQLRQVNVAHDVLSGIQSRQEFDNEWRRRHFLDSSALSDGSDPGSADLIYAQALTYAQELRERYMDQRELRKSLVESNDELTKLLHQSTEMVQELMQQLRELEEERHRRADIAMALRNLISGVDESGHRAGLADRVKDRLSELVESIDERP